MNTVDKILNNIFKQGYIYGYMYGNHKGYKQDKIIKINLSDLRISLNTIKPSLYYIWGWPGPDVSVYYFEDYGEIWALDKAEINEK